MTFVTAILPWFPRFNPTRDNAVVVQITTSDCEPQALGRCHFEGVVNVHLNLGGVAHRLPPI